MKITFSCESCMSEFTVDEELAGRSGRCKKCGTRFTIPSPAAAAAHPQDLRLVSMSAVAIPGRVASSVADRKVSTASPARREPPPRQDSLMDRLASSLSLKPASDEQMRLAQPKAAWTSAKATSSQGKAPLPKGAKGWLDAVNSQIAMKPVSMENLGSLRRAQELEPDSAFSYRPSAPDMRRIREKKKGSRGQGFVKQSYDDLFRNVAKLFRWINEAAYGISILFMILACVGYVMQLTESGSATSPKGGKSSREVQLPSSTGTKALPLPNHRLITIGVSGIVILNLIRLGAGLANLIAIPFRKSPIEGLMFLIPPFTFFYIWQHWKRMEKPVGRIVGPLCALGLVVAAYTIIPRLEKGGRSKGGLVNQVNDAVQNLKKDVSGSVEQMQNQVESIQNKIPSQIDQAKKAVEGLQDRVRQPDGQPQPGSVAPDNK